MVIVGLGVCLGLAPGKDMAALCLVNLGGLGIGFVAGIDMAGLVLVCSGLAPGEDMARLVNLRGLGTVF